LFLRHVEATNKEGRVVAVIFTIQPVLNILKYLRSGSRVGQRWNVYITDGAFHTPEGYYLYGKDVSGINGILKIGIGLMDSNI